MCILQTSILALPLSYVVLVEEDSGTFTKRYFFQTVAFAFD